MNKQLLSLAGVAGLLLTSGGCVVGPNYKTPSVPVPSAFKEEPPAGWKDAQPNDGVIRGKWWTIYGDPKLGALEAQVNISNQNVLQAEALYRQAKAAVSVSRAAQSPTVGTSPSAVNARSASIGSTGEYSVPFSFSYQIDIWGSIRRTVAANSATAQASEAQLENARLLYQSELATDYFEIQGLDASRQLLEETVKSYEKYAELTKNRFDGGVASQGDVALAQTALETARAQLVDLGVQRAQFEHAAAVLVGKAPAELSITDTGKQSVPPVIPMAIPSSLLERRPDIAAAERQVAASNEQIGITKAAFYPTLTLGASAGSQTTSITDLLSWPTRFWSVGPTLAETLFDGGKRRAQVQSAQASYDANVANYRQTVLTAFQQVEDGLAQLRILSNEAEITDRAVKAAQQSLSISTIQYTGGLANYLQVITSQTSALQNEHTAVDLLTRRMVASVTLIQALGGGWDASQLPSTAALRH